MPLLFGDFFKFVLEFLLFSASGFIILLVLVQRGRGGGLTGALGGMGGQSAFGAKAGDVFTRITVIAAVVWICLCLITIRTYTYVNVNTTAMKEYQYTKLMKDGASLTGEGTSLNESIELGKNPDDGPGANLISNDSEEDKKEAKSDNESDEKSAPEKSGDSPEGKGNSKVEDEKKSDDQNPSGDGKSAESSDGNKDDPKKVNGKDGASSEKK